MQQTLLLIPHAWLDGPLLWVWLVLGFLWLVGLYLRAGFAEVLGFLPFYLIVCALIKFVLPVVEIDDINPEQPLGEYVKAGLAIRGYGVCLLAAIMAGVGLTCYRAKKVGISSDLIVRLAVWMVIAGVAGARLFFIIQKRDEFFVGASPWQMLINLVDATKGGLVVYGSLIGGTIAAAIFFRWYRLPVFRTADLIAPGMVLGLAIGRIGCLMNGCCYGGICDVEGLPKIRFPAGSPPYMQQMINGELIGIRTLGTKTKSDDSESPYPFRASQVIAGSIAQQRGLQTGDQFAVKPIDEGLVRFIKSGRPTDPKKRIDPSLLVVSDKVTFSVASSELPDRSVQVHPAQIYSSLDAFLLCLLLWFFWYCRKGDGQVFALMLFLHGISRFLLELVRQDEVGAFGSSLTISQWISILMIVLGIVLFGWAGLHASETQRLEATKPKFD
jgi:phosphatidylglycerol---prolipoprotein diacylglyceryl transferase